MTPPRALAPLTALALALAAWETLVRVNGVPAYILPAPSLVLTTLWSDRAVLAPSLLVTLRTAMAALFLATTGGLALAILFARARWLERALYPFAVIMQVTPVVAIAPLLLIYAEPQTAVLACAFLVAFFPILANASLGLSSTDRGLVDLFRLSRATRMQELVHLRLPAALPQILAGIRIGGGLSLVGAVVAEIAAGTAGAGAGLAFRIVEAGYRLNIPRMFAALVLIALAGLVIFAVLNWLSARLLSPWHESAAPRRLG